MEFYFVKLNVNGGYLSLVDPNCKTRYMCFSDKDSVNKCMYYISNFRSRHGIWPSFDMSENRRKLEAKNNVKTRSVDQVTRYLDIETYDFNTIDRIAERANVSFYCVLTFDSMTNGVEEVIQMSGQEMDGVVDPVKYTQWLDLSLKTK